MPHIIDSETGERKWVEEKANSPFPCQPTEEQLARLGGYSREELITLVRRFACQCGAAAMMTEDETAQAMLDTLAETALKPIVAGLSMRADIQSRMSAIDKWLDRTRGKATQTINMNQNVNSKTLVVHLTTEQINSELAKLELPNGVKLLENGTIEVEQPANGS